MKRFDRITVNTAVVSGQPCIRGMRLTVKRVLAAAALYPNRDELQREYPELEAEDIRRARDFAVCAFDCGQTDGRLNEHSIFDMSIHAKRHT